MARTHIGPGTRVAGPLSGDDDLVVEGTVDGPVEGAAEVVIAKGARVAGPIRGRDVIIGGAVSQPVFATGTIRLLATAEVNAELTAPRVAIDESAVFEGRVKRIANAGVKEKPTTSPSPTTTTTTTTITPTITATKAREIPSLPEIGRTKIVRRPT
jgi:cytoskeletal protein CcmA (bactofilin family)